VNELLAALSPTLRESKLPPTNLHLSGLLGMMTGYLEICGIQLELETRGKEQIVHLHLIQYTAVALGEADVPVVH
jgi:hypothetical protein